MLGSGKKWESRELFWDGEPQGSGCRRDSCVRRRGHSGVVITEPCSKPLRYAPGRCLSAPGARRGGSRRARVSAGRFRRPHPSSTLQPFIRRGHPCLVITLSRPGPGKRQQPTQGDSQTCTQRQTEIERDRRARLISLIEMIDQMTAVCPWRRPRSIGFDTGLASEPMTCAHSDGVERPHLAVQRQLGGRS